MNLLEDIVWKGVQSSTNTFTGVVSFVHLSEWTTVPVEEISIVQQRMFASYVCCQIQMHIKDNVLPFL